MMRTKSKVMLTARVPEVVKDLVRLERGDMSDGEFIEQLVIRSVQTEQGRALLARWAEANPVMQAWVDALPKIGLVAVN